MPDAQQNPNQHATDVSIDDLSTTVEDLTSLKQTVVSQYDGTKGMSSSNGITRH